MQLKRRHRLPEQTPAQSGFMLVEVLVSIVLSAVALLALAGVSAMTLRYTKMSQYRVVATLLATNLGERMRANKAGFLAQGYDFSATSFAGQSAPATLPAQSCDSAGSFCTALEIAQLDLAQWRQQARRLLPEGSAFVLRQADAVGADVWLAWRDPLLANTDESPRRAAECPDGLAAADPSIRCSYLRINL